MELPGAGECYYLSAGIGMAASFNEELMLQTADVISTEARAKYQLTLNKGQHLQLWDSLSGRPILIFFVIRDGDVGRKLTVRIHSSRPPWNSFCEKAFR
jgi:hypothetical protein